MHQQIVPNEINILLKKHFIQTQCRICTEYTQSAVAWANLVQANNLTTLNRTQQYKPHKNITNPVLPPLYTYYIIFQSFKAIML